MKYRYDSDQTCPLCKDKYDSVDDVSEGLHKIFGICDACGSNVNVNVQLKKLLDKYKNSREKIGWFTRLFRLPKMDACAYRHAKEIRDAEGIVTNKQKLRDNYLKTDEEIVEDAL